MVFIIVAGLIMINRLKEKQLSNSTENTLVTENTLEREREREQIRQWNVRKNKRKRGR